MDLMLHQAKKSAAKPFSKRQLKRSFIKNQGHSTILTFIITKKIMFTSSQHLTRDMGLLYLHFVNNDNASIVVRSARN